MRVICVICIFFITSCSLQQPVLNRKNTDFNKIPKNWEYLYSLELDAAIKNNDAAAFYFFWPLYIQARYQNKCKLHNPLHNIECNCPQ